MGQKVNPINFRLGKIFTWKSYWFAKKTDYPKYIKTEYEIRKYLDEELMSAGLVDVNIERAFGKMKIFLKVVKPGIVIGKGGKNLEKIKKKIESIVKDPSIRIEVRVKEEKKPDLSAKLICRRLQTQLINRYPHRRAVNQALDRAMAAGAKGIKIQLSGRIAGTEVGRTEKYSRGKVPTQTIRANIDYFESPAKTRSGYVGIKVWVYKGEIL